MCQRNIARSFGCFATPIVATTRVYGCLPTFSQLSCGTTYCQSEAIVVERYRQNITAKIVVAAALVQNATGELLLVREGGTVRFMLPVGKIEPGETSLQALARELREELGTISKA